MLLCEPRQQPVLFACTPADLPSVGAPMGAGLECGRRPWASVKAGKTRCGVQKLVCQVVTRLSTG